MSNIRCLIQDRRVASEHNGRICLPVSSQIHSPSPWLLSPPTRRLRDRFRFIFCVCLSVCLSVPFAGLLIGDCLIGLLEQSVDSVCLWQATTFSPNSPRPPVFQNTEKERKATPREGFVEKE